MTHTNSIPTAATADHPEPMEQSPLLVYSTQWCGSCRRLKSQLDRLGITFTEIDIEGSPEAAQFVESVNQGDRTVPTVRLPDGTVLSNPGVNEVVRRLETLS